jgi:hypothetical protein
VVPLAGQSGEFEPVPQSVHFTQSEPVGKSKVSPWLLGLVILAAMSVGAAGALALDYYRNYKHEEAQAAIQPSDAAVSTETRQAQPTIEETRQVETNAAATAPAPVNADKAERASSNTAKTATVANTVPTEKSPEPVAKPRSPATQPERPAREERKQQDEKQAETREARRERQREVTDEEGTEDPDARARARRQRHPRDIEARPENVPPQLKRANQELHRIREIFEGTRP